MEAWPHILVRLTRAPVATIACGMSFASREKAVLSQWEVGVALVAGGGPLARLPRTMGSNAPWKCFSGPTTSGATWLRPMAM